MEDLGAAHSSDPAPLMLGGGNPAHIPEIQVTARKRMEAILDQPGEFERLIGNYDTPQGAMPFLEALADLSAAADLEKLRAAEIRQLWVGLDV